MVARNFSRFHFREYSDIIFICWTFNFKCNVGRAIYEIKILTKC